MAGNRESAYFPRRYLTDFFLFIKKHSDRFQVITYADLDWGDDYDWSRRYPEERKRWRAGLRRGRFDPSKAHVLIQYDVDSHAHRTMDLLRTPEHAGLPANIMIFNRRVDRPHLAKTGEVCFTAYELDHDLLERCQRAGHVIGYHTNAVEQACFDLERAEEIFESDLSALRERYDVRFFSPHGGVVGPQGQRNRSLQLSAARELNVRWVHNGATPKFKAGFTDGGHNAAQPPPETWDLRDFVDTFRPGERYRIVIHPQYYGTNWAQSESFGKANWYRELLADAKSQASLWRKVSVGPASGDAGAERPSGATSLQSTLKRWSIAWRQRSPR